jgi:RNA polymerase sigma-70 factor, ECF subfamily
MATDDQDEMDRSPPFEIRYLAFLEAITQLRPRLHRYCSRMTGSVMDGEECRSGCLVPGLWQA